MTSSSRADICHWHLEFSFYDKEKVIEFLRLLLEKDIDFPFSYEMVLTETRTKHVVTIEDMSWANNLTAVAKILEKVDYRMDGIPS